MSTGDISVLFTGEWAEYLQTAALRNGTTVDEVLIEALTDHRVNDAYWNAGGNTVIRSI